MDDHSLTALGIFLVIGVLGVLYVLGDGEAERINSQILDEPSWVQNLENRGLDPTKYPGYGCNHGRMHFGC